MITAEDIFAGLTIVTFAVAMVLAPISFFRLFRAKTRHAYWKNIALFIIPILLVFVFAELAGFDTGLTRPSLPPPSEVPSVGDVFSAMPRTQAVILVAIAVIWIGGGNLLFHLHNRRLGKSWWQSLNPLDPPFKDFNRREWTILGILFAVSFGLLIAAVNISHAN